MRRAERNEARPRLMGVRLGELERTLLLAAPPAATLGGLPIEAPEGTRSAQQGYLRAAKKLEELGLVQRRVIKQAIRAHDPRRERPTYRGGRFWYRSDPSRRQIVPRVFIWVTHFGEAVRRLYSYELTTRTSIRWTTEKIRMAERYAATRYTNQDDEQATVDEIRSRLDAPEPQQRYVEAYPEEVKTKQDHKRWLLAVAVARRSQQKAGSAKVWDVACSLYRSRSSTASLQKKAKTRPPAGDRPPLRFHRSELGVIHATDPDVAREWLRRYGQRS